MYKKLLSFVICAIGSMFLIHTLAFASEDVLEDEDAPVSDNYLKEIRIDSLESFKWIYSTAVLTVYFNNGTFKQGFALLLQDGFYLTSSELTYNEGLYPQKIIAKMQDDSADPLICIAQLRLKVMDSNKGLSLLETTAFTDDYCNTRAESYYHKRIYDKYAQNIFSKKPTQELIKDGLYYPIIKQADTFGVRRTYFIKEENHYNQKLAKEISYGYSLPFDDQGRFVFGKPYFDKNGDFLGIFSVLTDSYLPVLIKKEIVQAFICESTEKNILKDQVFSNVCKNHFYHINSQTKIANNTQK
ncbi:hypothetical protein BKH42_07465 [Helicobacter sp. 13S00482-2]|uniref:hypothetical protein n=1 Tax=Helicobacter sp. 13S00482-2 TaxID=1476200 RepID=UPI000BA6F306|nr:hypothetical protein [Helicobacter sp. 13S00482-2]PAF53177.1 hypothetical protein BKH42_07465 [Helicobacter sp. 13S00482-2]